MDMDKDMDKDMDIDIDIRWRRFSYRQIIHTKLLSSIKVLPSARQSFQINILKRYKSPGEFELKTKSIPKKD
jgi:hypothetical protein